MVKWLAALMAAMAIGMGLAIVNRLAPGLKRLVRAIALGLVGILLFIALSIGAAAWSFEAWWALAIGGAFALVALYLGWHLRPRRAPPSALTPLASQDLIPDLPPPDARWKSFTRELDFIGRGQARDAREAIAALLIERESPALTADHHELILRVERRVPELIDTCLDRCRHARPDERDRYLDETLERLRAIGGEAEQARREIRAADDRRLETLHRYFDGTSNRRLGS